MLDISQRSRIGLFCSILAALLACSAPDGGANDGQHAPGDEAGGVTLGLGDIAVSPSDRFVLFERQDTLAVGWTDTGTVEPLPVRAPTRLVFSKVRPVVYVGSTDPSSRIVAVDVDTRTALWSTALGEASTGDLRIIATSDDSRVIAADASDGSVRVLAAATGAVEQTIALGSHIVDIQMLPDDQRALVVLSHTWKSGAASTRVVLVSLASGAQVTIAVPNCSDRIAIAPDGQRGFLAPTTCRAPSASSAKDPISVLDLAPGKERFVRNLPGFGPVALSPAGGMAVGFLDRDTIDASLFDDPTQIPAASSDRYHLMLIDTGTLGFKLVEAGSKLPRFAVTPDGNVLLVDSGYTANVPARLFDVSAGAWKFIDGAPLLLDNFVITSDSLHAYVIESHYYEGLYDLDIQGGKSSEVSLTFAPRNINISANDQTLYLRKNDNELCVFSLAERRCTANLVESKVVLN